MRRTAHAVNAPDNQSSSADNNGNGLTFHSCAVKVIDVPYISILIRPTLVTPVWHQHKSIKAHGNRRQTYEFIIHHALLCIYTIHILYTVYTMRQKKRTKFLLHASFLMLDRNWWIFLNTLRNSISYNSLYLILACVKNCVIMKLKLQYYKH